MNDFSYLGGRVKKHALPVFNGPAGACAPSLKRLLLPQGELAQFHDAEQPMRYMAYIGLQEGTVRGNHYHERKEEWIYLIQGEMQLMVEDIESKKRETVPMTAGDQVIIQIRVAHALHIIADGQAVEFSPVRYDAADTFPYPLT